MKTLIIVRKIFRITLLVSLIFRVTFREKLSYTIDVISYVLLAIGLVGMITLEIIIYMRNKASTHVE